MTKFTLMKHVQPFLYGFFDFDKQIQKDNYINPNFQSFSGNIHFNDYSFLDKDQVRLYINARIYNLEEIRSILKMDSDDLRELIFGLYRKEGVRGFRNLDGKFTIIIQEDFKTTIVRDRNGEGRMIYFTNEFFTDTYQRIFEFRNFHKQPDLVSLITFLQNGYIPAPSTGLVGVQKIPPGGILYVNEKGISLSSLYNFDEILAIERNDISQNDAIEQYEDLLKNAIKRRICNAEEVGVLLSGGYDSGGNLAMLREIFTGKIKTFSVGFKNNPASELPYAKLIAEKYNSEHHEYQLDGNDLDFLPDLVDSMGDPFSESGFMVNYVAMKMAGNENLEVTLGGDGNDQYFGVGARETAIYYLMRKYGLMPISKLIDTVTDINIFDSDNIIFRVQFQNKKILRIMEPEIFGFHDYHLKKMFPIRKVLKPAYLKEIPHNFKNYEELYLLRNYFLHTQNSAYEVIINKASRLAEHFCVHLAFPSTDLKIYQFIQELPINLRTKGTILDTAKGKGVTKYIHKELIRPKLPESTTNRPKQGGFSPLEIFFQNTARRKSIYNYIQSSGFAETIKDPDYLKLMFSQYESLITKKNYWFWYKQVKSNQILNLLIISLWWDKVFRNRKLGDLSTYLSI